jgi:hypothetical protein
MNMGGSGEARGAIGGKAVLNGEKWGWQGHDPGGRAHAVRPLSRADSGRLPLMLSRRPTAPRSCPLATRHPPVATQLSPVLTHDPPRLTRSSPICTYPPPAIPPNAHSLPGAYPFLPAARLLQPSLYLLRPVPGSRRPAPDSASRSAVVLPESSRRPLPPADPGPSLHIRHTPSAPQIGLLRPSTPHGRSTPPPRAAPTASGPLTALPATVTPPTPSDIDSPRHPCHGPPLHPPTPPVPHPSFPPLTPLHHP